MTTFTSMGSIRHTPLQYQNKSEISSENSNQKHVNHWKNQLEKTLEDTNNIDRYSQLDPMKTRIQ